MIMSEGLRNRIKGPVRCDGRSTYTTKQIPLEVWDSYGDFPVRTSNGYLYALVPKQRLPRWVKSKQISIAKLVWFCHHPTHRFAPMEKLMYIDGDRENNQIDNLKLGGTQA